MPDRSDRIVIRGLIVDAFIGVLDDERRRRQRVRFDIEIEAVHNYANVVRDDGRYISYADVVDHIRRRAASEDHVELVETWAEDIATFVLSNELVASVTVSVTKPDIFADAEAVGVVITRCARA